MFISTHKTCERDDFLANVQPQKLIHDLLQNI